MNILGINAYHGDASAAVVTDGQLVAAAEEERFNRIKHSAGIPHEAIRYCLGEAGLSIADVDIIAIPRDPKARLLRKMYYGFKIPRLALRRLTAWKKTSSVKERVAELFDLSETSFKAKIIPVEHHKAHLASSFFVSPFDEALLVSMDGLGDFASTMWGVGRGNRIEILGSIPFPHSLGMYYTAITQYLGFLSYGDEYKVMGLASYGEPDQKDEFEKILRNHGKSGFKLGLDYFLHHRKLVDMNFEEGYPSLEIIYSPYLEKRLGSHREKSEPIERRHQNIAATLQARLEDVTFSYLNGLSKRHGEKNLALAGGVAYNCVVNGKLFDRTPFQDLYIQPAAGDAGLAIGAAYYVWHQVLDKPRTYVMDHAYWGPGYSDERIEKELSLNSESLGTHGCRVTRVAEEGQLCGWTAEQIAAGKIVGWFQGRMEWGPRALGNRSIVVDPRRTDMKDVLNARIKHREPFRPFAPSILEEKTGEFFERSSISPFMLLAYKVRPEKQDTIPAPTHVDGTGRLQTVSRAVNPRYWRLIKEFEKLTGVPVLLNTSFNENEPIVCTPKEALDCFVRTKMDVLVMGNQIVEKAEAG